MRRGSRWWAHLPRWSTSSAPNRDAGADEFIVPEWNFGPMARRKDTCDLFITEVAPHLRWSRSA